MANKALSKRQKLMIRNEPARALKPRNPIAVAARQRAAGAHQKSASGERQLQQKLLDRLLNDKE
ncbi:hypothetical protein SAMN06265795_101415 [Noviherbaspirillum humi]|uniref:Uncharacterized protein n=1 Tax=Noviherbaspirillum humi TaxID=1688639 RepID=A0A239CFR0_9BURK|nr:hypothetical protein [Noviherbaspirillum humi]SNS18511.1 hypothetical protein SAMN06265795_101415 [Noviherbaspirillum humi]